jgi:hypothetical protein
LHLSGETLAETVAQVPLIPDESFKLESLVVLATSDYLQLSKPFKFWFEGNLNEHKLLKLLGGAICLRIVKVNKSSIQVSLLKCLHHRIQKVLGDGHPTLGGMVRYLHFYTKRFI